MTNFQHDTIFPTNSQSKDNNKQSQISEDFYYTVVRGMIKCLIDEAISPIIERIDRLEAAQSATQAPPEDTSPTTTSMPSEVTAKPSQVSIRPHEIQDKARKSLKGSEFGIWDFLWHKTVDCDKEWAIISRDEFDKALPYSNRAMDDAIKRLIDKDWIEREWQKDRNIYSYRIHPDRMPVSSPESPHNPPQKPAREETSMPSGEDQEIQEREKERKESTKEKKEKEKEVPLPKPNLSTCYNSNSKNIATIPKNQDQGAGASLKIQKAKEIPMVREMIRYGVNESIVMKALIAKGETWVRRIYREFNEHVCQAHNMRSPAAVLASRLKDYDESWRKEPEDEPDDDISGHHERQYTVAPERIRYWQGRAEFHIGNGAPADDVFRDIIRAMAAEQEIPPWIIVGRGLLNMHGAEPDIPMPADSLLERYCSDTQIADRLEVA